MTSTFSEYAALVKITGLFLGLALLFRKCPTVGLVRERGTGVRDSTSVHGCRRRMISPKEKEKERGRLDIGHLNKLNECI